MAGNMAITVIATGFPVSDLDGSEEDGPMPSAASASSSGGASTQSGKSGENLRAILASKNTRTSSSTTGTGGSGGSASGLRLLSKNGAASASGTNEQVIS